MTDGASIVEAARTRPREERLALLQELLLDFAGRGGLSVIPAPGGRYVWSYFVPEVVARPPAPGPDDRLELQRRLDTIDDAVDAGEVTVGFHQWARTSGPQL